MFFSSIAFLLALITIGLGFILLYLHRKEQAEFLRWSGLLIIIGGALALACISYHSLRLHFSNDSYYGHPRMMHERMIPKRSTMNERGMQDHSGYRMHDEGMMNKRSMMNERGMQDHSGYRMHNKGMMDNGSMMYDRNEKDAEGSMMNERGMQDHSGYRMHDEGMMDNGSMMRNQDDRPQEGDSYRNDSENHHKKGPMMNGDSSESSQEG
ncbi:MAG: hypothetical protein ACQEP8_01810 [Chlamydiota bacterium]